MNSKINIEEPLLKSHLKENCYTLPEGYFGSLKEEISKATTTEKANSKESLWTLLRPQAALVGAFAILFVIAYGVFGLTGSLERGSVDSLTKSNAISLIEEGFIKSSFIDFFESDSAITSSTKISQDELLDYINNNIDLVTLSSLDFGE